MENDVPMTLSKSKSKLGAEFQYGGRPFSETGSSGPDLVKSGRMELRDNIL